jgi:hypothetical protein
MAFETFDRPIYAQRKHFIQEIAGQYRRAAAVVRRGASEVRHKTVSHQAGWHRVAHIGEAISSSRSSPAL